MRCLILFFTLLFSTFVLPVGFIGDTKFLTPSGFVAVKILKSGDLVTCFDNEKGGFAHFD